MGRGAWWAPLAWAATKPEQRATTTHGHRCRRDFREHRHTQGRALQGVARERLKDRRQAGQGWEAREARQWAAGGAAQRRNGRGSRAVMLLRGVRRPGTVGTPGRAHSTSPFTEAAAEGDRLEGKGTLRLLRGVLGGVAASAASCCCSRPVASRTTSTATLTFRGAPQMLHNGTERRGKGAWARQGRRARGRAA